jgi:hypothetical protein
MNTFLAPVYAPLPVLHYNRDPLALNLTDNQTISLVVKYLVQYVSFRLSSELIHSICVQNNFYIILSMFKTRNFFFDQ